NDGGATWVSTGTSYVNTSSWTQESVSLPAWNNSPAFKIRFKWQNGGGGLDPAFSIDHVLISGIASVSHSISTTNDASPASWCFNSTPTGTINFTSSGTYTAGNVYTAQLSDATGSFAAPTSIGTLSSTASGALSIATSIPSGIAAGAGYRVRVVSSNPATTGTDNTADLIINALPTVSMGALSDVCVYNSAFSLTQGAPASGAYSGTGVSGGTFTPSTAGLGAHTITYTYTDGNNCMNTANAIINVNACASIDELNTESFFIFPNPVETSFQVVGIDAESKVELVDFSGKIISSFDKAQDTFDVSNLSKGIYIVRITNGTETVLIKLGKK
uniref:T9SS type A sorting domain-containing protein n=1 Tax=Fluviicola sp. TaxID=1917219 RepID=UPI004049AA64